jgi:hypothetical protein
VGDQCWHVREGQPAAARSSATRSTSPAKNTTSSKPPLASQDCSVYPVVVLATAGTGAGEAPDSVRKVGDRDALAVPRLVPLPNPGAVGATGGADG